LPSALLIFIGLEAISFATPTLMNRKIVSVNEKKREKGIMTLLKK
jgi:hypothetical protein